MGRVVEFLTLGQARRIALAAQGFGTVRPGIATTSRQLLAVVQKTGVLQIDSVNVLSRSHYLPLFSRLGAYDRELLHRAAYAPPRQVFEYWAHEASYVPMPTYQLWQWRRDEWREKAWGDVRRLEQEQPGLVEAVWREIEQYGPMTATEVERRLEHDVLRTRDNWGWNWSQVKTALEVLFWSGRVMAAARNGQFQRLYDVPARVVPAQYLAIPAPSRSESIRELTDKAAQACGIGSLRCLRDYYRFSVADTRQAVAELVEAGRLQPVTVRGWDAPLYLHALVRRPRKLESRALLSPFDSLVFERRRLEALFSFYYRLEIYTPEPKRQYGYYVLPFLLGDALVARVDLKADRAASRLVVRGAYGELGAPENTAIELAAELRLMADWLGLAGISVELRGNLAEALRACI